MGNWPLERHACFPSRIRCFFARRALPFRRENCRHLPSLAQTGSSLAATTQHPSFRDANVTECPNIAELSEPAKVVAANSRIALKVGLLLPPAQTPNTELFAPQRLCRQQSPWPSSCVCIPIVATRPQSHWRRARVFGRCFKSGCVTCVARALCAQPNTWNKADNWGDSWVPCMRRSTLVSTLSGCWLMSTAHVRRSEAILVSP